MTSSQRWFRQRRSITCNTAHHWHAALAQRSRAPLLHIAQASVAALPADQRAPVALFATRGTLASGFYQRALAAHGAVLRLPEPAVQPRIDACIQSVKAGALADGSRHLARALAAMREQGVAAVILACTELPLAAAPLPPQGMQLIDSSLELARLAVQQAALRGWLPTADTNPPGPPSHQAARFPSHSLARPPKGEPACS